ncbi:HTH-type transcriptional regulator PtxR [Jeongeupia sp. HS-3]|uniref:LysR family transcriptional regulator n=1 Tax=Jeongeupia sp. HS-3 TaxID=1009682 RepID=UPI0018A476DE|nr:LysR family transcriptional regulator [Jeongeupia sp. HS-3]BCL74842.1 HTH-type transcriptional regulator PtxR [Jeongeupia sp. HS-3]
MRNAIDLNRLAVFAAVAEAGSFTAAAERLSKPKSMVSQQISRLEAELGATLFTRTTRKVALTEAGNALFDECAPLLREMQAAVERLEAGRREPSGLLRLTVAADYAATVLAPLIVSFLARYPHMEVEVVTASEQLDLVAERLDLAIRMGWLKDSTLRAVPLGDFGQWVVASPAYLRKHAAPQTPGELAAHRWVALSLLRAPLQWTFGTPDGGQETVRVKAALRTNSTSALQGLVAAGAGVSTLPDFMVAEQVRDGTLQRLLTAYALPRAGIYAVYPDGRHLPAKVRAFIDHVRDALTAA